jgi:hypothetical protein
MAKTLKDFLNERQLGPMVVKNPDEQKFIDKHVVAKTDDRNGNDDELFKGSKVKMADRPKHRKGYNPGEDEEVYEALKGDQHKIDANKNGKVDAHDFHLLRKKKKVAEEAEELEELDHKLGGTLSRYINKTKGDDKREDGRNLALKKRWGDAKYGTPEPKVKAAVREEAEELEELSTDTLRNYRAKAKDDAYDAADVDDDRRLRKRSMGSWDAGKKILKRGDALRKEEAEQIDEISAEKKDAYAQKAGKQLPGLFAKSNSADGARKYYNRKNAVRKIANEEAEQIDEILDTPEKAANYKAKAQKSFSKNVWISGDKAAHQTAKKRLYGLSHPKVAEEIEIEEKLNMDKASMGTVIKDFQKSDAPQFQGKSQKKRQVMAIAAKLSAERGGKPLNKEERLLTKLADISETHKRTMVSVFEKLNEDNQREFMLACDTAEGIEQMLDFSIQHRGE